MKKVITFLGIIISFFFLLNTQVRANSINDIEMDVYIDESGNALVTEVWKANLNQGTEGYRPFTDLGNSTIENFSVSDESGIQYESLSNWRINSSFSDKAYKSGLHYISDGVELCWGISKYGNRTYTLKYTISNFVTQYTDTQGIYFDFINLDQYVDNAKIIIHSDKSFSLSNARIWGYGNDGTINFENGNIVFNSNGSLTSTEYMVALVRFESNLFNTSNTSTSSFDDIYDSAMSDVNDEDTTTKSNPGGIKYFISRTFMLIVFILLNPVTLFLIIFNVVIRKNKSSLNSNTGFLDFGVAGRDLPSDNNINYWRDIPCNKDLERAYWVAYNYNVVPSNTLREGIIGAILLKWLKEGQITISKTKKGLFSFKDNNYAIDFNNMQGANNEIENRLFELLISAAGINNLLEANEFEKWCKKNYEKIQSWFFWFNWKVQAELESQGMITLSQKEVTGMFGRKKIVTSKQVNPQLKEEAMQLKGLKKFLLDFSIMPEREYFEVHIWEEYLIYAQLLGIADKVEEQFSKIYPKFNEQTRLNTEITTVAIRNMANIGYRGYEAGRRMSSLKQSFKDYSGRSRSSGGGGDSYSSGGSSSGGSSGGGFR